MALIVDYSKYYYKWGTIRYRWLEFGEKHGKRRLVDDYLETFFSRRSPFVKATCFDESKQLLMPYSEYMKTRTELEAKIGMDLPIIGETRLSKTNPVVDPVRISNVQQLKSTLRRINNENTPIRYQQQKKAKEHEEKVKEYIRENPEPTFLVLDIEMYEHKRSLITEIGFAVFKRRHYEEAKYFHYIVAENRQYLNKDHVPDNRDGFKFGKSVVASLEDAKEALREQLKDADAVLGHSIKEDVNALEGVTFDGKFVVDTQGLAMAKASKPIPMSLKHVLETYGVQFKMEDFHNAGNDCYYTIKAFEKLTKNY